MEVNKLESREVMFVLFGMPVMITLIVLVSIGVGHFVTTRSDRPTNVNVSAAAPKVDVNVPQAAAPNVSVSAAPPKIEVNVPHSIPPAVNVTTPPAVVTVVDRRDDVERDPAPKAAPVERAIPAGAPVPSDAKPGDGGKKASSMLRPPAPLGQEEVTLDTLYKYAESYIDSYCKKNNLDAGTEATRWGKQWKQALDQSIADGTDSSEQTYINRTVVAKRNYFDMEKATPAQIVEGCRIMLRYRDGQLAWLQAMRDAVTGDTMKKTLVLLAAGVP